MKGKRRKKRGATAAVSRRQADQQFQELLLFAVAQVKARNPDIDRAPRQLSAADYAERLAEWERYERKAIEPLYEALRGEPISPLISEDREES